jgi:hypothetical protein
MRQSNARGEEASDGEAFLAHNISKVYNPPVPGQQLSGGLNYIYRTTNANGYGVIWMSLGPYQSSPRRPRRIRGDVLAMRVADGQLA